MHSEHAIGTSKALSGKDACRRLNSDLTVDVYEEFFTVENAIRLVQQYDVVIDATDNVVAR
jgi:molybdopterin/thiamine biosynthesis adenylyltransferase